MSSVEERKLGLVRSRVGEGERAILALLHHVREIRHEVTREHEDAWNSGRPDVLLSVGLSVEMRNMDKSAVGGLGDVQERGKDDVRNTSFLGCICNVLSLSNLNLRVHGFPVVGNEEYGVRSLNYLGNRLLRIEIGLQKQFRTGQWLLRSNAYIDKLSSLLSQSFGRWFRVVSGNSSDLDTVLDM